MYGKVGQAGDGLRVVAEELATEHNSGQPFYEAELYRLKGEFMRMRETPAEHQAEAGFRRAIDSARSRQAKSLELRAVMRLGRLWQRQGQHEAARQLPEEIYTWFTGGFDTADLQQAKVLLEELPR